VNPLDALYDAVGWVLTHIYYVLKPAFGATSGWTWALTIVILVVLMRLLMVPLFIRQMHTTRAMSSLQPQMAALRKKYKNDKQTLNQETMKLYQEAGVNPLMGCLPFVLQLPLFFSLFSVLRAIADWKVGTKPSDGPQREDPGREPVRQGAVHPRPERAAARQAGHPGRGPGQHVDDLPHDPPEHEARDDAGRDAGQPDGEHAEVHGVHHAAVRADRPVLAVRPGSVLVHHEHLDAGPAVSSGPALPLHAACGRWSRHGRGWRRQGSRAHGDRQRTDLGFEPGERQGLDCRQAGRQRPGDGFARVRLRVLGQRRFRGWGWQHAAEAGSAF
jgi:hypothetical protein